jgi:hypothetical protein
MSTELSKTLNEIGIKAKAASAILNTASSDQKNKFLTLLLRQSKKMQMPFWKPIKLISKQQKAIKKMKLLLIV